MQIYVSRDDIEQGRKTSFSNTHCPVARAIKRATRKRNVLVGVYWYIIGKEYIHEKKQPLPKKVSKFIDKMISSKGEELEPFKFSLKIA